MTINMRKGDAPVSLQKTDLITFKCTWPAATDYDLYAIVVYANGGFEYIATFPAGNKKGFINPAYEFPPKLVNHDGSVRHLGDVGRGQGVGTEIIEVRLNPSIRAVIPVAYSAQSNGTGSFFQYKVTTEILAGSQKVVVKANNASKDKMIYTLVPGMVINEADHVGVHALELYSVRDSELRPSVQVINGQVIPLMDQGPKNAFK